MKALVWLGPRDIGLREVDEVTPNEGEVVLRVHAVGICGSDLSGYLGENSLRRPPLVMGHEFCGSVVTTAAETPLRPGDHVVVNPLVTDGRCALCLSGRQNLCVSRAIIGVHRPGALAASVAVPAGSCIAIPVDLDHAAAALIEPVACALRVVEVGRVHVGEGVLVIGAGPVGLLIVEAARAAGADRVVAMDTNRRRLDAAMQVGATGVVDPARGDPLRAVSDLMGGSGCDVAVDAVGLQVTRRQAIAAVGPGGRVVLFGLHEDESMIPANLVVRSELEILGAFTYTPRTFERAAALVAGGAFHPDAAWCELRPIDEGPEWFRRLVDDPLAPAKIQLVP